jgi:hypothetical protein
MQPHCSQVMSKFYNLQYINPHAPHLFSCIAGGGYAWLCGLVCIYVGAAALMSYLALDFARRCTLIEQPAIQILRNLHHNMSAHELTQPNRALQKTIHLLQHNRKNQRQRTQRRSSAVRSANSHTSDDKHSKPKDDLDAVEDGICFCAGPFVEAHAVLGQHLVGDHDERFYALCWRRQYCSQRHHVHRSYLRANGGSYHCDGYSVGSCRWRVSYCHAPDREHDGEDDQADLCDVNAVFPALVERED